MIESLYKLILAGYSESIFIYSDEKHRRPSSPSHTALPGAPSTRRLTCSRTHRQTAIGASRERQNSTSGFLLKLDLL
jgi:hypothetical protein